MLVCSYDLRLVDATLALAPSSPRALRFSAGAFSHAVLAPYSSSLFDLIGASPPSLSRAAQSPRKVNSLEVLTTGIPRVTDVRGVHLVLLRIVQPVHDGVHVQTEYAAVTVRTMEGRSFSPPHPYCRIFVSSRSLSIHPTLESELYYSVAAL